MINFITSLFRRGIKPPQLTTYKEIEYLPETLQVECGNLSIRSIIPDGDGKHKRIGLGFMIKVDGKEIPVRSLTLRIAVDEIVSMTVEQYVGFGKSEV
jgi:hypothetical protein